MTTPIQKPVLHSPHKIVITIITDEVTGATEVKFSKPINPLYFAALLSQLATEQLKLVITNSKPIPQSEVPTNGG